MGDGASKPRLRRTRTASRWCGTVMNSWPATSTSLALGIVARISSGCVVSKASTLWSSITSTELLPQGHGVPPCVVPDGAGQVGRVDVDVVRLEGHQRVVHPRP